MSADCHKTATQYAVHRHVSASYIRRLRRQQRVVVCPHGKIDHLATDALLAATLSSTRGGDRSGSAGVQVSEMSHSVRRENATDVLRRENAIDVLDALMQISASAAPTLEVGDISTITLVALELIEQMRGPSSPRCRSDGAVSEPELWSLGRIAGQARRIDHLLFIVSGAASVQGNADWSRRALETLSLHAAQMAKEIADACGALIATQSDRTSGVAS